MKNPNRLRPRNAAFLMAMAVLAALPAVAEPRADLLLSMARYLSAKNARVEITPRTDQMRGDSARITNVYLGSDIREVFADIAGAAKVAIVVDDSIKPTPVFIEFENEPLESAIAKTSLLAGAFWKKRGNGVYLVSLGTPEAPLFREFAKVQTYRPRSMPAESIAALISPAYRAFVATDKIGNVISVTAPDEMAAVILADIKAIDMPSRQFVVEALVTEVTSGEGEDFGFSWSWKNFAVGDNLTLNYSKANFADIAKLKMLIETRKASLRANPKMTAFEGKESILAVGQDTYFSILSGNVNFPTAQIQLIKTGVTLKFTGFIDDDGTITLDLEPEVSDAVVTVAGNPTTNVRRVSTSVRVKSGETIAIGGLVQESKSTRIIGVPILSQIPLIGELFKQRVRDDKKTEVIILITPRITEQGVSRDEGG